MISVKDLIPSGVRVRFIRSVEMGNTDELWTVAEGSLATTRYLSGLHDFGVELDDGRRISCSPNDVQCLDD